MKVSIEIKCDSVAELSGVFSQVWPGEGDAPKDIQELAIKASLEEVGDKLGLAWAKNREKIRMYPNKSLNVEILGSQALTIFGLYNGYKDESYLCTVLASICEQIEEQLFIKGPYRVPKKGGL